MSLHQAEIDRVNASLRTPDRAVVNGVEAVALSGETIAQIDPATGAAFASVPNFHAEDVDRAVASARRAFERGDWLRLGPAGRKKVLLRLADLVEAEQLSLAVLECRNIGKPISDTFDDIAAAALYLRWYAEAADKLYDEIGPTPPNYVGLITREPVGVVGAITPWNFPLSIAALKIAPALAVGCSVILKPSELSSLTAIRLGVLALEAGIPPGVLNVITGLGPMTGQALADHGDVDCIAFTGSGRTGRLLMAASARSNMKRIWLELGGKTPNIILDDCVDIDAAVAASSDAIFYNQGQVCSASSRMIATPGVIDALSERMSARARALRPGAPMRVETELGAIVSEAQLDKVLGYVRSGVEEGAQLLAGGERDMAAGSGYFMSPTVFGGVSNSMRIAREEIFGPVLSIIAAADVEDAVRIANDTEYGLAASVWTGSLSTAHKVARALRSGRVGINCCEGGGIVMPFGGFKQSGNGRDQSLHAFDKFTELKSTYIKLN